MAYEGVWTVTGIGWGAATSSNANWKLGKEVL